MKLACDWKVHEIMVKNWERSWGQQGLVHRDWFDLIQNTIVRVGEGARSRLQKFKSWPRHLPTALLFKRKPIRTTYLAMSHVVQVVIIIRVNVKVTRWKCHECIVQARYNTDNFPNYIYLIIRPWIRFNGCSLQWRHNERDGVSNH